MKHKRILRLKRFKINFEIYTLNSFKYYANRFSNQSNYLLYSIVQDTI